MKANVIVRAEGRDSLELLRLFEIGIWRTIRLDDAFRQEIGDSGVLLRDVGGEDVIKSTILTDDDDDMLDGCFRFWCLPFGGILRGLRESDKGIEKNCGEACGSFSALPQRPWIKTGHT